MISGLLSRRPFPVRVFYLQDAQGLGQCADPALFLLRGHPAVAPVEQHPHAVGEHHAEITIE